MNVLFIILMMEHLIFSEEQEKNVIFFWKKTHKKGHSWTVFSGIPGKYGGYVQVNYNLLIIIKHQSINVKEMQ